MANRSQLILLPMFCLFLAGACALVGLAQQDESDKQARVRRLEKMTGRWQKFQASLLRDKTQVKVQPVPKPLLRWIDVARQDTPIKDGTIWAWGTEGRPVALLAQEVKESRWVCELVSASTSSQRLSVVTDQGWQWSPERSGLQLIEFPEAPEPAQNRAARLTQMKALVRRITIAKFTQDGTKHELRALARPIHRYEAKTTGLIDGAMFAFALGTNPESVAVVEAQRTDSTTRWKCGFLRVCTARIEAQIDEKPVWSNSLPAPNNRSRQDPYTSYATTESAD